MKVIISGYGKMGHMVEEELKEKGIELVEASEDIVATKPEVARECVCIDFTTPDAFKANYRFIAEHFKAAVVGTTGWNDIKDEVLECFRKAGTTMIYASNFSIGVNALFAATRKACEVLKGAGYTPSVEEVHHIHKLDAPSGTAKSLGAIIEESLRPRRRGAGDPHGGFPVGLRPADAPPRGILPQGARRRCRRRRPPDRDPPRRPRVQRCDIVV